MSNEAFVLLLAGAYVLLLRWACKALPSENWQILASIPISKDEQGRWQGVNLTYYGLLTANAFVVAVAMLCILVTAIGASISGILIIVCGILLVCLTASRLVAKMVEKKAATFTIAGASFIGLLLAPWLVAFVNWEVGRTPGFPLPIMAVLAAVLITYAFGEGLGRLACISFGCCYGKPVSQVSPTLRRLFDRWSFVFSGSLKKIAYASGMAGEPVIPIQAMTSVLSMITGLTATLLFLRSYFSTAFVLVILMTQGWRIVSETLRADYRGEGRISAYQIMGLLGIPYALSLPWLFPSAATPSPNLIVGIQALWNPSVVFFLQGTWLVAFVFFGKSLVTGSQISFHVHLDKI